MKDFFPKTITKKQASDSGMAIVLILLLIGLLSGNNLYYKISILVLVMNMIYPMFYYYLLNFTTNTIKMQQNCYDGSPNPPAAYFSGPVVYLPGLCMSW